MAVHAIRIGTSGWQYRHWRRVLYPESLPVSGWLERYAQVFDTVELNNTFYRLPGEQAVDAWRERTPAGFLFACKGSRYLTHMKRLLDTGPGVSRYLGLIERLRAKLGPILWQLPPQMARADAGRLDAFLEALPPRLRVAVEFRSEAWYTPAIAAVLDRHGAAFCEHDLVDRRPPRFTGGFRYARFHGTAGPYHGRYGRRALAPFAKDLQLFARREGDAFVYFNNDTGGHAVHDALDLLELVDQPAGASTARTRASSSSRVKGLGRNGTRSPSATPSSK